MESAGVISLVNGAAQGGRNRGKEIQVRSGQNVQMEDQPGVNQSHINLEGGLDARERELRQHLDVVV